MTQETDRIALENDAARIEGEIQGLYKVVDALNSRAFALNGDRIKILQKIEALSPIEDSVAWVPSFSRTGSHLTTVINGEGFCTCEDAKYRAPKGGCKHFNAAIAAGYHDTRATFRGGFDGPVDLATRREPVIADTGYDALVFDGVSIQ